MNTLFPLRGKYRWAAERGRHGEGSDKTGRSGADTVILVPCGTQAWDIESGKLLGELLAEGERLEVAAGGDGGRGNARFATATNRAPRRAEPGFPGEERELRLELKLIADVGVVGLPNAGKSTFISRVTAARPKIADYPFTTLVPQLGVVASDVMADPFVIADLPGLIEGASEGAGLGYRFLRHVERCRVLLHLVDLSTIEGDVADDLEAIEKELGAFRQELLDRPRLIVGSKADAGLPERRQGLRAAAAERGAPYFEISSVTGEGLAVALRELARRLAEAKRAEGAEDSEETVEWSPLGPPRGEDS